MKSTEEYSQISHQHKVEAKVNEILDLLQEECAEVIQAVSKCRRFGLDNQHKSGKTHREELVQEIGDVALLIELLHAYELYSHKELHGAKNSKSQKLAKYSSIYEI